MEEIFLIKKIWTDTMENQSYNAVGYSIVGFVETEEVAKEMTSKGRMFTQNDCWAIWDGPIPEFKYEKVIRCTT